MIVALAVVAMSCSSSRVAFDPERKYSVPELQKDYSLFRNILEESHPSLYWFTSKDSMNYFFDYGYSQIKDSMTEPAFKNILSYVANKVHCGHTSVRYSKKYSHYLDTAKLKVFPLAFKVWPDSAIIIGNLNRHDSLLKRGMVITGIDGYSMRQITDTFSCYLSGDGYSRNSKYQFMSNRGSFGTLYRNVFGIHDSVRVNFTNEEGITQSTVISMYDPKFSDTSKKDTSRAAAPPRDQQRITVLNGARYIQIDTTLSSGYMTVNTFSRGNRLRPFFRKAFRVLRERKIQNLVIDVRTNGGGDAGISTMLTRYIANKKFKLADSLYAVRRSSQYGKYIQLQPFYWTFMQFVTHKKGDKNYHFGYFERHYFKPKKHNHFDGDVYIITGGNSFSATTLFAKVLQGQSNVKIVGEETGGGAYGNSAWMIPDVTLPVTKLRFRLPKFRLVMDQSLVKEGRGIIPDVEVAPTPETVRRGIDPKVEYVRKMIMRKSGVAHQ
jgi:hypothetical protein